MLQYLTSYRAYLLAKAGLALAFLWYTCDFLLIHLALWHGQLGQLLVRPEAPLFSGDPDVNDLLVPVASFLDHHWVVWLLVLASPVLVALFLWGRHRWLQFATGCLISFSLISLTASIDVFHSTADVWLNLTFVCYAVAALVSPTDQWNRSELSFSPDRWKQNPQLNSTYALLVVVLQFSVYLFAGINKLHDGWQPWTHGTAIQNLLAYDNSVRPFAQGFHVPYWLSLSLCYVTLAQRLIVPFGFFFRKTRLWSFLILASMHVGYALLLNVNLFPLVGLASLLLVLPPKLAPVPVRPRKARGARQPPAKQPGLRWPRAVAVSCLCLFFLGEGLRLTLDAATPLESTLLLAPDWRMFSGGGTSPFGQWRLVLDTPKGPFDATALAQQALPHLWRDRFYANMIYAAVLSRVFGENSYVRALVETTEQHFRSHQLALGQDPTILGSKFVITVRDKTYTRHVTWSPN